MTLMTLPAPVAAVATVATVERSDADDALVAHHESGHAVAAVVLRNRLLSVSIEPDDERGSAGRCVIPPPPSFLELGPSYAPAYLILRQMAITYAGPLAELRARAEAGQPATWDDLAVGMNRGGASWDGDSPQLVDLVLSLSSDWDAQERYHQIAKHRAAAVVDAHWSAITRVAEALRERRTLTGAEVRALVRTAR